MHHLHSFYTLFEMLYILSKQLLRLFRISQILQHLFRSYVIGHSGKTKFELIFSPDLLINLFSTILSSFSLFYVFAELWGSVVLSLLFWGQANAVMSVAQAKKYYPLFGIGANVALLVAGAFMETASSISEKFCASSGDLYGTNLKFLMSAVVASTGVMVACHKYIHDKVITDPECVDESLVRKSKAKTKMTLLQSAKHLASSAYIRNLATMVICYGMAINIVEVTWKGTLMKVYPEPTAYSEFLGKFSEITGAATIAMMVAGQTIFKRFGWGGAAKMPPAILLGSGIAFFSLILAPDMWNPVTAFLGTTPLMLAMLVGAFQNVVSKSSKYALLDPCKEMAFIPLSPEEKTKGKAAIDVIGSPLGKSGGSMIQQVHSIS